MKQGIKHLRYWGLIVSLLGSINSAQAVSVNEAGLGEALLFPFYSVVNGNDTTLNIVNTRNEVKAVKVTFREGMNGQEVLTLNLYLAPFDHWSGVITRDPNGDGALFKTQDKSCTVPSLPTAGQPFNPVLFAADSNNGTQRTREGYIEIIEMGVVVDGFNTFASDVTHVGDGYPADCLSLISAWGGEGVWLTDPTVDILPNTGGLYGYSFLLNVNAGTAAAYNATALSGFAPTQAILHASPGLLQPTLKDANPIAKFIDNDSFYSINTATGLDAVSTVLMKDTIRNDFVLEPIINAGTDWVLTFPTKHDYVNGHLDGVGDPIALAPFTVPWDAATSQSCEAVTPKVTVPAFTHYNREGDKIEAVNGPYTLPPPSHKLSFCAETNVLTLGGSEVLGSLVAGNIAHHFDPQFTNGWMEIDFKASTAELPIGTRELTGTNHTLSGLPVIGFAIQKYVNSTLIVGGQTVLSNYAGAMPHHATRDIF